MTWTKKSKRRVIILLIILILLVPFSVIQNQWLVTSEILVTSETLPAAFGDYRIVQLSDLHSAWFGKHQNRLIKGVTKQRPNLIVITGDLVDGNHYNEAPAIELVKGLSALAPVYICLGNHEAWSGVDDSPGGFLEKLQAAGGTILRGDSVVIQHKGATALLGGLDDPDFSHDNQWKSLEDSFASNPTAYKIVLSHRPELFDKYVLNGFDLIFTGHAHGGQVRLPFIGGLVAPDQGFYPEYDSGLYTKGKTHMIVNRGLGNSIVPQRLFNQPQIIIAVLKKDM